MTEFQRILEERANLHRRSDLMNLANAYNSIDEYIRDVLEPMKAEIVRIGTSEEWPPEGLIKDVYDRTANVTKGDPDMVPVQWRRYEPTVEFRW